MKKYLKYILIPLGIVLTSAITTISVLQIKATGTPSSTTYLRGDGTWATPSGGGSGDMVLASTQTVTGAKTFNNNTLLLAGSTSGNLTLRAAAIAGASIMNFPTGTRTVATLDGTETFTNKTISGSSNTINNLNASNLSSGAVPDARLSSNVMLFNKQSLTTNNSLATTSFLGFGSNATTYEVIYTAVDQASPNNSIHGKLHVYISAIGNTYTQDMITQTITGVGILGGAIAYNDYSGTFSVTSFGGGSVSWYLDIMVYLN